MGGSVTARSRKKASSRSDREFALFRGLKYRGVTFRDIIDIEISYEMDLLRIAGEDIRKPDAGSDK